MTARDSLGVQSSFFVDLTALYFPFCLHLAYQLMVIALVQKCNREARRNGHGPPTDLGYLLCEFFEFYGTKLAYPTTGELSL